MTLPLRCCYHIAKFTAPQILTASDWAHRVGFLEFMRDRFGRPVSRTESESAAQEEAERLEAFIIQQSALDQTAREFSMAVAYHLAPWPEENEPSAFDEWLAGPALAAFRFLRGSWDVQTPGFGEGPTYTKHGRQPFPLTDGYTRKAGAKPVQSPPCRSFEFSDEAAMIIARKEYQRTFDFVEQEVNRLKQKGEVA